MINTIYLLKYRNGSHISFNNDLIRICEDSDPDALLIRAQFDAFLAGIVSMESVYKLMLGNAITAKITEEDDVRDNIVIGIEKMAEAYTHHFDPAYVDAAHLILKHIKKYGKSIARLSYQEESVALNDLIDNQKNDAQLNAAVTLLGLTEWFVKLEESNKRFKNLYIDRVKDNALKPEVSLKSLRKESFNHYKELIKHLESHAIVSPSVLYSAVIKEINRLIDKYNANIKNRKNNDVDEPIE